MKLSFPWTEDTVGSRLETALERASRDPAAASVFTKLLPDRARAQAGASAGVDTRLSGALISVKALFDVAGETTTAGTKVLNGEPSALADAPVIARLVDAGGVFVGLSNMSEFAYSGLGLNPHFGTSDNPIYPGCAPGGSTSGGAVSVALGICDVAIGSDTGGSLRIPAAFTGITGFKPTQASVPMAGGKPLSDSLDSFGPMAKDVATCELAWQVMADLPTDKTPAVPSRVIIPSNFGFTEIEPGVAAGFFSMVTALRGVGLEVIETKLETISLYDSILPWHMTSVESRAHYETYFHRAADLFDPRVHARMARADEISAVQYRQTLNRRQEFISAFREELGDDMLLLPTTPMLPPCIDDLADERTFNRLNLLALRNPSLANVADGCGIAVPFQFEGNTLSAMLIASGGRDNALLACAKFIEAKLKTYKAHA